jgi:hypothetical protein
MQINIDHSPTLDDMTKLTSIQYYLWNNNVYVNAIAINKLQIRFVCPFCRTRYNKNGEPSKRSKRVTHFHASCNNFHNRFEHRSPHCMDENINNRSFMIAVTDSTKREP